MSKDKFLVQLNDELINIINNKKGFDAVFKALKKKQLALFSEQFESNALFFKEINLLIDKMMNVIHNPHFQSIDEEVVLRSELSKSLTSEQFNKTVIDASLWKRKRSGVMQPEYVHSSEHIDTINIYENIALIYVYLEMMNYLENYKQESLAINNSIQEFYKQKGLVFAKYNIIDDLYKNSKEIAKFIQKDEQKVEEFDLFLKVYKKAKRIKQTSFYKVLQNKKIRLPLMPTNILIHDPNYNAIYRFYKKYMMISSKDDGTTYEELGNYVLLRLINDLTSTGYKFNKLPNVKMHNNLFNFIRPIVCRKDGFRYSISYSYPNIDVIVSYNKAAYSHHTINIRDRLTNYVFNENKDVNTFYVTLDNQCGHYYNIINLSIKKDGLEMNIFDSVFKSMRMHIPFEQDKLFRCPVCGSLRLENEKSHYYCEDCGSKMVKTKIKSKPSLWIQSLWRY